MTLLDVRELRVAYGDHVVVDGLTFSMQRGESLGLVGESGAGKTQTALAILGLLSPAATVSGSVAFDGTELVGADDRTLDAVRAVGIAMVFQDPADALNPYVTIGAQLTRILIAHGLARGREAEARVREMLASVGLPDPDRQYRAYPHQLSGGMRQRAMIASALITGPALLIADEATTALDVTVQAQILQLLDSIRRDTAMLMITHDLGVVAGHCERMLVLRDGRTVESGATADVFASPADPHTQAMLAAAPRLRPAAAPAPVSDELRLSVEAARVTWDGRVRAVNGVDLAVRSGETLAIVGESGSGKSSLARAILGLADEHEGRYRLGVETLPHSLRQRPPAQRLAMQLVFQDPMGSLDPQMTIADIVAEPLVVREPPPPRDERRRRAIAMLAEVGLDAVFGDRYPHQLSGGQAQRVAIARALIVEPSLLICDEAVAALDGTVREQILALLRDIQSRTGLSMLFISHDLGVVSSISHRVVVMYLGRIVESADCETLFRSPKHPYTRALIDAVPLPEPAASRPQPLGGEVPSPLTPPPGCVFHPRCRHAEPRCAEREPLLDDVDATAVRCIRARELTL
ncbi:MAG: ABC transporter ATP-binding protein [Woeseiaceae bacterium]|nr:ABC transporter ATP-binding protein [Woeseiaceae bacterium]